MARKPFVVVGAGVGGLAIALRLAHRGERVIVLERTGAVGGRCRRVQVGDCQFDAGPTLMMMLDPFERLFSDVGERMEDHLQIELCDPSYRVFYRDGARLDGSPNVARMVRQIEAMSGERDVQGYLRLLNDLAALYHASIPNFVRRNFYSPADFFGPKQLGLVTKHRMIGNLAKNVERYVQDPRLRMLFSFQTMYLGLSPYDAPWVYAVLTYMEYGQGIWYPKGGIARIAEAIAELGAVKGVEIRLDTEVCAVEGAAVRLATGERIESAGILMNADLPFAEREILHNEPSRAANRRYSCSAAMLYAEYDGELPDLLHHNVFFGTDFRGNLNALFHELQVPADPAFYACVSRRSQPELAPPGCENLYILVPSPNLDYAYQPGDADRIFDSALKRLEQEVGLDKSRIRAERRYLPQDWSTDLNLDRGAAFGLAHDFWQSAYFRPSNRSRSNPNVTFVGASTAPGNGLPMVLISAELAEQRLAREGRI